MRRHNLLVLFVLVGGCATLSGSKGSTTAASPGKAVVEARSKELLAKSEVAKACPSKGNEQDKGGILEATVGPDGKVSARSIDWKGDPSISACIIAEAAKLSLAPQPGPAVSTLWMFGLALPPPPPPSDQLKSLVRDFHDKLNDEVTACANRYLPPEFPATISGTIYALPGGRAVAVNVLDSTSNDGEFDNCVLQAMKNSHPPETGYEGPYPLPQAFRVGPLQAK